ncbi:DUF2948 family protein [Rhodobaculum claviforme]|uniref:DUF2948 family protein n=1 Tax=Rhodobaculum claviforme TaxID=1549854 RepID=A0A934WJF4_9RHOB|nr:DUF2948 family protein [Rhodobaculum claviforme]MBK5927794.1 hypothetical protein [Rhodobaculum claviforme]
MTPPPVDDARYADGAEAPLRLRAQDEGDLRVISALVQDAVFPASEMRLIRRGRRMAVLLNRFRWENGARRAERVQALLVVHDVLRAATEGFVPGDADTVLSLLALTFTPGVDGGGRLGLTLSGDGAVHLEVECIEVTLTDVTRPYAAPSGRAPVHPDAPDTGDG